MSKDSLVDSKLLYSDVAKSTANQMLKTLIESNVDTLKRSEKLLQNYHESKRSKDGGAENHTMVATDAEYDKDIVELKVTDTLLSMIEPDGYVSIASQLLIGTAIVGSAQMIHATTTANEFYSHIIKLLELSILKNNDEEHQAHNVRIKAMAYEMCNTLITMTAREVKKNINYVHQNTTDAIASTEELDPSTTTNTTESTMHDAASVTEEDAVDVTGSVEGTGSGAGAGTGAGSFHDIPE